MSRVHNVLVTEAPEFPLPEIEPDSFSVQAISRKFRLSDDGLSICLAGTFCEVENESLIYNGYGGDFDPPLIMRLNASPFAIVEWVCQTGQNYAPITDNGDGSYSCDPIYSATDPILVYALVYWPSSIGSDGGPAISSEVRTYFMLQAPN